VNIQPLLDALDIQEDAARALADDLRAQIDDLQTRLQEAETHLEHFAITRKTVTSLADRLPALAPDLPEHPDYPLILAAFNQASGPLRAKDVREVLGHEPHDNVVRCRVRSMLIRTQPCVKSHAGSDLPARSARSTGVDMA
jgi:hypothetical protein